MVQTVCISASSLLFPIFTLSPIMGNRSEISLCIYTFFSVKAYCKMQTVQCYLLSYSPDLFYKIETK